jgi:putative acyl-CoA dehydrogenase
VRTIIQMVQLTRLDCAIARPGSCAWRWRRREHHARHRTAFQKHLADQPMSGRCRLALEAEGATALVRLAVRPTLPAAMARGGAQARALTAASQICGVPRAPGFAYEAMECLGGNGYVEESLLPRPPRGAGQCDLGRLRNVMCLDVIRALGHTGGATSPLSPMKPPTCRKRETARAVETALAAPDANAQRRSAGLRPCAAAAWRAGRAARGRRAVRAHPARSPPRRHVRGKRRPRRGACRLLERAPLPA